MRVDLDLTTTRPEALAALSALPGLGPKSVRAVAERSPTLGAAVDLAAKSIADGVRHAYLTRPAAASLADVDLVARLLDAASEELEAHRAAGGAVLWMYGDDWPSLLRDVDDQPAVLRVLGRPEFPALSCACIGTRDPNAFGETVSRRMTAMLCEAGVSIVSGLAKGVDRICHDAAIAAGGHTVAVLGCGLRSARADRRGIDSVLAAGGAVVSEFACGEDVTPSNLLTRNRTVTGISAATCAMQGSASTGGTRKAVSDAFRQNRPVFMPVPPPAHADPARDALIAFAEAHERSASLHLVAGRGDYALMLDVVARSSRREWTPSDRPASAGPSP